ncbi:MAG: glycosyltransferase [Candidatus Woesebacteria bacterium]|jgi:glycosyltransferase involved in cell wall biosynthesis
MTKKPFFSIIIPTLNEERYLPRLLKNLAEQTFKNFEVIHVDGNSDDQTVSKAKAFAKKLSIKTFVVKKRSVSFQRNTGAKKAKAKWIIFMDADIELPASFLEKIEKKLTKLKKKVDFFTCYQESKNYPLKFKLLAHSSNLISTIMKKFRSLAPGALLGIRKIYTTKISFNQKFDGYEDYDYCNQASKKGYQFQLFKNPKFTYSMRRVKKEGLIKILFEQFKLNLELTRKKQLVNKSKRKMLGGASYN